MIKYKSIIINNLMWCIIFFVILNLNIANIKASNRQSGLRTFGDIAQIVNPLLVSAIAMQEKGFGHFAIIYGQSWLLMQSSKYISMKNKFSFSKRPNVQGKKDRYDGMPSGHTASAWAAAAYVRTFSEDYKYMAIPLYVSAALTGYSRIYSKEHTAEQVIVGAVLAEIVTFVNSKLKWSNQYRYLDINMQKNGASASFVLRF